MANTFALQVRIIFPLSGHPYISHYMFILCDKGMLDQTYTAGHIKLRYGLRKIEPTQILQNR